MIRYTVLKKAITRNGQLDNHKINGKPVSCFQACFEQNRYDPIRKEPRFLAIVETPNASAK